MNIPTTIQRQQGVALFLSLIMLLVLTVLGVSSFQNSHIQERSAGNARLQAVAFEAAAAGASDAINFFDANRELGDDQSCGELDHEGWQNASDWVGMGSVGEANLKQRLYCLADDYPDEEGGRPAKSQLFVLSRGEVISEGNVVAQRDVEVRLDIGGTGAAGDGCGALCFPTCEGGSYDFPTSNDFRVVGENGGYAVTGGMGDECDESGLIRDGIRDNRMGNYIGGVGGTEPGHPWDNPTSVEAFREHVMLAAQAAQLAGDCLANCYTGESVEDMGNSQYGATGGSEQITYIEGDAHMGGTVSGAGLMVVNGDLYWNGTPPYEGLIVVLGGDFEISGGGRGGDQAGSVVTVNLDSGSLEFGPSTFDTTGGGTAEFVYSCEALQMAWNLLADSGGGNLWSPECESGAQNPYDAGPTELIIASWRENIGWREGFFDAEAASE